MKLIFCPECFDVVKFEMKKRYCKCKSSWGNYLKDGNHATFGGATIPLAISNLSLYKALFKRKENDILGTFFFGWVFSKNHTFKYEKESKKYKKARKWYDSISNKQLDKMEKTFKKIYKGTPMRKDFLEIQQRTINKS